MYSTFAGLRCQCLDIRRPRLAQPVVTPETHLVTVVKISKRGIVSAANVAVRNSHKLPEKQSAFGIRGPDNREQAWGHSRGIGEAELAWAVTLYFNCSEQN